MNRKTLLWVALLLCLLTPFISYTQGTCGVFEKPDNPDPATIDGQYYYDRFGNIFTEKELIVDEKFTTKQLSGIFNLNILPGFSTDETETICAVFLYLSTLIDLGPQGVSPIINIQKSDLGYGVLGTASPFFSSRGCGYSNNTIFNVMMGGLDQGQNPSIQVGYLNINEAYTYHTINNDPIQPYSYDLYSVVLHEALHILGYSSLIGLNGNSQSGYYSMWDEYLFDTDINEFLIENTVSGSSSCCEFASFNDLLAFPEDVNDGCNNNIFFSNGSPIAQVNANYGGTPLSNGVVSNILSHLDRCGSPGGGFVMKSSLAAGDTIRQLQQEEKDILYTLGYPKTGSPSEECRLIGVSDFIPINGPTEIPFSVFLENDIFSPGASISATTLGSIFNNADVTINANSITIENAAYGIFSFYYLLEGCDGACYQVRSSLFHLPVLEDCQPCDPNELFCHGSFDDILPNRGYGIEPALGLPFCLYDNGVQSSADVMILPSGGNVVLLGGGLDLNSFLERMYIPLPAPAFPGCKMEICFDAGAFNCNDPIGIDIYGTATENCSGLWASDCNGSAPYYCVATTEPMECQSGGYGQNIDCTHPLYPPEYGCDPGVDVPLINYEVDLKHICIEITNQTLEGWNYIVLSREAMESSGHVLIDNLTITGDCCPKEPCGVELLETCKENTVVLTVLQNGVPIPMYNANCCVSWSGINGIPTIGCTPKPGLPSQNFNNIGVPYGETYCVEVSCEDGCDFIYCGKAGDACVGGENKAQFGFVSPDTQSEFQLAPNPVHNQLQIAGQIITAGQSWEIYNIQGQLIWQGQIETDLIQEIPMHSLNPGIFYFVLKSSSGTLLNAKRFVKQ
ncbi:MAG: T9SS type A sorting domain-containing protein [Saprospiraceae bacterium]|nr:T9SS type A sorting domain-containing protein [Saprospiraceae bacterium]